MIEITYIVAIVVALGAATASASQNLLIRVGTERGTPFDAVFVVITVNVLLLVPLVLLVYFPSYNLTGISWGAFIGAGLVGTLMGRLFMYTSISRIGASRATPIVASWALISSVLGILLLGEAVSPVHAVGIVCIVTGVGVIAWETSHENPDNLGRRALIIGILLPVGAAMAYGMEPIFANVGFREGTPAPVGLMVKTVAAYLGFSLYLRLHHALPSWRVLRSRNTRYFVLAGVMNTLFLLGYYVGIAIAPVSVVTPILATNTLIVVVLSAAVMPEHLERVTWRLVAASLVVVAGVIVITVFT